MTDSFLDDEPPLIIHDSGVVFQEQGGASFAVEAFHGVVRASGEPITLHVTSVKGGRPGAVCAVVLPGSISDEGSAGDAGHLDGYRYLLARHWRVATNQWEWEFPRGMGEIGETPEQTAVRELREETALEVSEDAVSILQVIHADTGILRDAIAVARIRLDDSRHNRKFAGMHKPQGSDWKLEHFRWIGAQEFLEAVAHGEIVDGITLSAFLVCEAARLQRR
ncbi:NUDIX hydrolase [Bifidobacterium mongoliense]|uniref:NUDIX hydrolase n=1 Tax=Bifidobacterium mongoliense TaxID=518643 RepID=UPI0030ECCD59